MKQPALSFGNIQFFNLGFSFQDSIQSILLSVSSCAGGLWIIPNTKVVSALDLDGAGK